MKLHYLFLILFLSFSFFTACVTEEDEEDAEGKACVTVADCPQGFSCIDAKCHSSVAATTDDDNDSDEKQSELSDSDSGNPEEPSVDDDKDALEDIDSEIQGCPNACSGFGECDFTTGKCTCNENHGGEDCSGCAAGYHLEAEGDDEDGNPDVLSCVVNKTCQDNPQPCNNNGCTQKGDTVACECLENITHLSGRWCEGCAEGYLKSNVDGKCKPDCDNVTCSGKQKCGVDYTTNEAGCNLCENEFYSGENCDSCDVAHFCGEHTSACKVENNTEKCICETGFVSNNNRCVKECDTSRCFREFSCEIGFVVATVEGHCNPSTCECDQGWLTGTSAYGEGESLTCPPLKLGGLESLFFETRNNVLCTVCDKNNPPSQYISTGCPVTCYANFCNGDSTENGQGICYNEVGTGKMYCKCVSGYTMTGDSKYYDENPTGQCE